MKFDRIAVGLHCHSLDDFPVHDTGRNADSLLACWTALWHPKLLSQFRQVPNWIRLGDSITSEADNAQPLHHANDSTESAFPDSSSFNDVSGGEQAASNESQHEHAEDSTSPPAILLVVPRPYINDLETQWVQQIEQAGGQVVFDDSGDRDQLLRQILTLVGEPGDATPSDGLWQDFLALGFAYLHIELLTRHMHYSTQMSESAFVESLMLAADSAVNNGVDPSPETLKTQLQTCFDYLSQERDHYYAVDVYLVDVTLLAESLIGEPLQQQLESEIQPNLLFEASLFESLESEQPDNLRALQAAVEASEAGLIGGDYRELPSSLVSLDTVRDQLQHGQQEFERVFGRRSAVYGRRSFGLTPALPQLLLKLGFDGAMHATFDGGQFPEANQSKSRWEGNGGYSLDAVMRAPLDATQPETFLKLASSLGSTIDTDHIATRCFVHWAGQMSPWYHELLRATRYTQALGRFVTIEEYFRDTYDPGLHDKFRADQYRSPYLKELVF